MSSGQALIAILGLAAVTVVTRGFFLLPEREWPTPPWLIRGLRFAPLAALAAIIAPEVILLPDGSLIEHWTEPRLLAVAAGTAYFWWQRGIFGTIFVGTAVMLAVRLGMS